MISFKNSKCLNTGLWTALKSFYTSKEGKKSCYLHWIAEKPDEIRQTAVRPSYFKRELLGTLSNKIQHFPCCNKVQHMLMKAKGDDLSTSDSPEETGSNQNQMVNKKTVLYLWVCVSCSLMYLKWVFPNCHMSIQKNNVQYHLFWRKTL